MENMRIWEKYKAVPKEALKDFSTGSFKGSDINTIWRIKCLTHEFGPCGTGWYYDLVRTWTELGINDVVMAFAEIKFYYKTDGEWSKGISAVGGSQLIQYFNSKKYNQNDDDGYKKAITDAFGVACKYLGLGANVYWGNDKTKYTSNNDVPEPVKMVTTEQLAELEKYKTNFANVCSTFKISKKEDMTYAAAEQVLQIKRKQNESK